MRKSLVFNQLESGVFTQRELVLIYSWKGIASSWVSCGASGVSGASGAGEESGRVIGGARWGEVGQSGVVERAERAES